MWINFQGGLQGNPLNLMCVVPLFSLPFPA
jgi:hypothetical protein